MSSDKESIALIYRDESVEVGAKGLGERFAKAAEKVGTLSTETISNNMVRFCQSVSKALQGVELTDLPYQLDSVELTVELTGSGDVRLIGGIGAELSGGVKLKFRRR